MRRPNASLLVLLGFLLAACAGGESARTVEVTLDDTMTIDLAETEFDIGETIVFRVTNDGAMRHEFMVGDAAAQEEFAEEMGDGDMAHDTDGGVSVEPGATETFRYTFEQAGEILAACHETGHYEAGMVAAMTVSD